MLGWLRATPPEDTPLAKRLRRETKPLHRLAEATRFAKAFFQSKLDASIYVEGLQRMAPVYRAMEHALRHLPDGSIIAPFLLPEVFRTPAIEADLAHFGKRARTTEHGGVSAEYRARIEAVAASERPWLLIAHAYVRYMADVSGGVIAGKVAKRVLRLPTDEGLAFFRFPDIASPATFRTLFRSKLDEAGRSLSEGDRLLLIAEANRAFDLNRRLADELFDEWSKNAA